MATGIAFIKWENYAGSDTMQPLFSSVPLTFNSDQEKLHELHAGDRLWLVSRHPADHQYYFVAMLVVRHVTLNEPGDPHAQFGRYRIECDPKLSIDLQHRFPAEGLLRVFTFSTNKPVRYGASLGQSVQRIRMLSDADENILNHALASLTSGQHDLLDLPCGLWTKCDRVFADYFLADWQSRRKPMAFLLYDSPPILPAGAPVFIHSDKTLRVLAAFKGSRYVAGHKQTATPDERIAQRDWIWSSFRENTLNPPPKSEFDLFWERQNGIRAFMLIDNLIEVPGGPQFKDYGRALQWGYPMGVGYQYLTLSQSLLLLRTTDLDSENARQYESSLWADSIWMLNAIQHTGRLSGTSAITCAHLLRLREWRELLP